MENVSWTVSHAQTEIQRPHMEEMRKFFQKLKIMDKDIDLALYHDLCRSLSITISRDRFNVKKTSRHISQLFQRSKVVSSYHTILPFFYGKRRRRHVVSKVETEVEGRHLHFAHL
jgi:hypothetical protein